MDLYKDISDLSLREPGEYYIGDIVQVKLPKWLNVKNGIICGFNHITDKWIIKSFNTKSNAKVEEIPEECIVKLKETTIKINNKRSVHKYDMELYKYLEQD